MWVKPAIRQSTDLLCKITMGQRRTGEMTARGVYGLRLRFPFGASGYIDNDDPKEGIFTYVMYHGGMVTPGAWHLLALRWDGATLSLFVDGKLVKATPYDPVPEYGLSYWGETDLMIGSAVAWGHANPDPTDFRGEIGPLTIYSRPRSEAEIAAEYAAMMLGPAAGEAAQH